MAKGYVGFPIFQPSGLLTKGIPFDVKDGPDGDSEIPLCPLCGADLTDKYIPGTGFAYGGFGTYWYCTSDDCDWYYKEMASDGE